MRSTALRGGLLALALMPVLTVAAGAHVTVQPAASRPADLQLYRVLVPNEREHADTIGVDVQLPDGIDFVLMDSAPDWKTRIVRDGGQPSQLVWSGGRVPPGGYAELNFIARNPVRTGTVQFKTLQRYSGGETVRWIGSSDSENPSPQVRLAEDVVPQDVVSVHGEKVPTTGAGASATPGAAAPQTEAATSDDGDDDLLPLILSGVALVVALAGAGVALRSARRTRHVAGDGADVS